jgi:organic radical activating enzyme
MNIKCNCCDGIYNSFDVHFTSACDSNCAHCIDKRFAGFGIVKPDVNAIVDTIVNNKDGMDDILFLGGEPCIFLDELLDCVKQLKQKTKLKVFATTAVPKVCKTKYDVFLELLDLLDGMNLSVQHYKENIADEIRRTISTYDRQEFYNNLPQKNKIRINLNIVKPYLYTKEDISNCLLHYDSMGFNSIKLSEIQHGKDVFVSFEETFGISLKSPYSYGCQTYLKMDEILQGFRTPVLLKRSCFLCEETLNASLQDGMKAFSKFFVRPSNNYGVIYEDGTLMKGWV